MDFDLTDDQREIKNVARELLTARSPFARVREAAAGSTVHLVSVFAPALAEVPGLAAAFIVSAFIVPACAAPGQPASTPRVRDPPATRLSAAARTCVRRMKTACLRCSSRLLRALYGVRRRLGDGWV